MLCSYKYLCFCTRRVSCLDDTRLLLCFLVPLKLPLMTSLRSYLQFRNNWCRQFLSNYDVEIDAHRLKCAIEYVMLLYPMLHSHYMRLRVQITKISSV